MKRFALIGFASLILVAATRIPLSPAQLFSFDDVNFAYAIGDFDIANSQPQPPGYPLFVLETRVLSWLRFKRAESNFLALSILGSAAALVSLVYFGNRILGRDSGLLAAALLLFHHSFWYSGLTSALRLQLALVSVVVAGLCFHAWSGERRWIYWSAIALGVGSGIRPEMGPLLLPLWLASTFRATRRARDWLAASALLTASVFAWLVPTVLATGGPRTYALLCWQYLTEQASLTSGAFGAQDERWYGTIAWLVVWSLSTLLALPAVAILAWQRGARSGLTRGQIVFMLLWFLPAFLFAIFVHVADPGQTLAIVPVVCLLGGYLIGRAMDVLNKSTPQLQPTIFAALPLTFALATLILHPRWVLVSVPVACIAAGLALRWPGNAPLTRTHSFVFFLSPVLFLNVLIFFQPVWYYKGPETSVHRVLQDLHSGLSFTSLAQIRNTIGVDHNTLMEIGRLSSERPGSSVVIWENGSTSWRKINYYFPTLRVVVLENKTLQAGSRPVATIRQGPSVEHTLESTFPVRVELAPRIRLIWVVNPNTPFYADLRRTFPLKPAGGFNHIFSSDLQGHREVRIGDYLIVW